MDIATRISASHGVLSCIDMHTSGEPTRIVYCGYPSLFGTLLEQRREAQKSHDHLRRRIILEPRGHREMYGALLRPYTEHTDQNGAAHMGVLFLTNEGYSTMCGHATIALGRFLIDTRDLNVFPRRNDVVFDEQTKTATLVLHAPCGLVQVTVPTIGDGTSSDPSRPVSHISVQSFATGIGIEVELPTSMQWPQLELRSQVKVDFSYGGAFYCMITAEQLGFPQGLKGVVDLAAMSTATQRLKAAINGDHRMKHYFRHPEHDDLSFLYSVIVVDDDLGVLLADSTGAETGLTFFGDQQVDRSPTGSGVAARIALTYAKSGRKEPRTYHSLLSNALCGKGGFVGRWHEDVREDQTGRPSVRVRVEGYASYTGCSKLSVEESDPLGDDGFLFERLQ